MSLRRCKIEEVTTINSLAGLDLAIQGGKLRRFNLLPWMAGSEVSAVRQENEVIGQWLDRHGLLSVVFDQEHIDFQPSLRATSRFPPSVIPPEGGI